MSNRPLSTRLSERSASKMERANANPASTAKHVSVLLCEAVDALAVRPGGRYIDGTLGRAGHSMEIARRGGSVLGIDRDDQALAEVAASGAAREWIDCGKLETVKGVHGDIAGIARKKGWNSIDGILLDLGVSSPQLDEAGRGFSFVREGPLDMRMDRSRGMTAADIVNGESEEHLEGIFRDYGDERQARRIARWIGSARKSRPFATTKDLADGVEKLVGRHGPHHPATRVFQALRMAVNDETGELERALSGGIGILAPGGRFVVITFESVTDRIVKRFFAEHVGRMVSLPQGGEKWEGTAPRARAVIRKAARASEEETVSNPRARSAKLRAIEIMEGR